MSSISKTGYDDTSRNEQNIQNLSFDEEFKVLAVEGLTFNPVSGALERSSAIQGNSSLVLGYDGSGNLTTIEKTIGSTVYTKTLSYTDGRLTGITTWSAS